MPSFRKFTHCRMGIADARYSAELHDSSKTTTSSRNPLTLTVLRSEYEDLLRDRQEYTALKQSLFGGGITQETLNVSVQRSGTVAVTHACPRSS
jgi:hypothetical protein